MTDHPDEFGGQSCAVSLFANLLIRVETYFEPGAPIGVVTGGHDNHCHFNVLCLRLCQ